MKSRREAWFTRCELTVGIAGIEPAADSLSGCCSDQMSYIQVVAKGSDYRRYAVLQRSGASEALGTSTIGNHQTFSSSSQIVTHYRVVVKKNFVNLVRAPQSGPGCRPRPPCSSPASDRAPT